MAWTRPKDLEQPIARLGTFPTKFDNWIEPCDASPQLVIPSGPPTADSVQLLFALPHSIMAEIFALVLAEDLFDDAVQIPFSGYVRFSTIVRESRELRHVCRAWTAQIREFLFARTAARSGLLALVEVYDLEDLQLLFPMLRQCAVTVDRPLNLHHLEVVASQIQCLSSAERSMVQGILFKGDDLYPDGFHRCGLVDNYDDYSSLAAARDAEMATKELVDEDSPELTHYLADEMLVLHHYHAHLLRCILSSLLPGVVYLVIPSFIVPVLLSNPTDWRPTHNSRFRDKLESVRDKGSSLAHILSQAQYVVFLGEPNLFVAPGAEEAPLLFQGLVTEGLARCNEIYASASTSLLPSSSSPAWAPRGIGLHGTLEVLNPENHAPWWLGFLRSLVTGVPSRKVSILTNPDSNYCVFLGPPNFHFRSTTDTFKAHPHLCEEFSKDYICKMTDLDLNVHTICPMLFQSARKRLPDLSGVWRITSAPQLCPHWVDLHPTSEINNNDNKNNSNSLEDLVVLRQIMDDAHGLVAKVDITVCFTYRVSQSVYDDDLDRELELCPREEKIRYRRRPRSCDVAVHSPALEAEFAVDAFFSTARTLLNSKERDGFGLFGVLDEMAGEELEDIIVRFGGEPGFEPGVQT